ncbi:MAG: PIN domain-containing protein [Bacteroidia bacterium]
MLTNQFAFVDYESYPNFHKKHDISELAGLILFLGCQQTKIPIELAKKLQPLGKDVHYICIGEISKNNLDFHLSAYLGMYHSSLSLDYEFIIYANDAGYDHLLIYLTKELGRKCTRIQAEEEELSQQELTVVKTIALDKEQSYHDTEADKRKVLDLCRNIKRITEKNRPKTREKLISFIEDYLKNHDNGYSSEQNLSILMRFGYIKLNQSMLCYNLTQVA